MSRLIMKTVLFAADFAGIAAITLSFYCYVFNITDKQGYAMDGVAFTVCVLSSIFVLVCNRINHAECDRIHS